MPVLNSYPIATLYTYIDEPSLVLGLKEKKHTALDYLYDRYSGALFGVILRILNREDLAEEVLQDVFLKIWNRIDHYDPQKGKLFTWMARLARNQAIDKTRSGEFAKGLKTGGIEMVVNQESDGQTLKLIDAIGIPDVLQTLPAEQKFVVEYVYFKGYTQSELAEEFQLPLGTIKTRLRLALQNLRNKMDKF